LSCVFPGELGAETLKQLGTFGQWIRDRLFPLFVPFIARELEHQYAALQEVSAAAA